MEEAFGLEEGAAPDADAEERSIRAVDADEARRARLRPRLAVREGAGGLLRESSRRHGLEDRVRGKRARPQQLAVPRREDETPRRSVLEQVRSHPGPHEPGERPARAEGRPEVGGERPHVEALAAGDPEYEIGQGERFQLNGVDGDLPSLTLDFHALPRQLVEAPPFLLEGRVHW